ncbi:MAG: response regulator [Clostridium sp.]|nr:response regulator [Clostridium sp.]
MIRLLIADDEVIERKVLYRTLEKHIGDQCRIFQAENGREALKIYEEEAVQIAILDIEMPGINGIEAAQAIREKDKDCCIIFLTAYDEFSYAKKAITVRALDYLLKPYDEQELMLVVDEAIRTASERRGKGSQEAPGSGAALESGQEELEDGGQIRLSKVAEIISRYICENYMYDISMQDLARTMNYSEAYFCKLFKQCFNKNFTAYLTEYRVEQAKKMLEEPTVNVKDIGKAVGYTDSNYFAKVFKRITGQSPTEYRLCIFQNT